jgi:hypothetical protein
LDHLKVGSISTQISKEIKLPDTVSLSVTFMFENYNTGIAYENLCCGAASFLCGSGKTFDATQELNNIT